MDKVSILQRISHYVCNTIHFCFIWTSVETQNEQVGKSICQIFMHYAYSIFSIFIVCQVLLEAHSLPFLNCIRLPNTRERTLITNRIRMRSNMTLSILNKCLKLLWVRACQRACTVACPKPLQYLLVWNPFIFFNLSFSFFFLSQEAHGYMFGFRSCHV